jgi:hypothetical protein
MTASENQDVLEFLATTVGGCCTPSDALHAHFEHLCRACAAAAEAAESMPRAGMPPVPVVDRRPRVERHSNG